MACMASCDSLGAGLHKMSANNGTKKCSQIREPYYSMAYLENTYAVFQIDVNWTLDWSPRPFHSGERRNSTQDIYEV